ncbi:MAG TPA: YciI family protein [Candidatus Limnocylindrales bacterium]
MAAGIPDGLAIERVWVVETTYSPDVEELRPPVRPEHLGRIAELRDSGVIIDAGAFADMSGSLIILRAPSEEDALGIIQSDVYFRAGVWNSCRIRALGRVVRTGELTTD